MVLNVRLLGCCGRSRLLKKVVEIRLPPIRTYRKTVTDPSEVYQAEKYKRTELYKFIDSLRIYVVGGQGGDGIPRRGGLGGRGGDVIVRGINKTGMTLKDVRLYKPDQKYKAGKGTKSKLFCLFGAKGENVYVPVPLGVTVLTDEGQKLGEINTAGDEVVVAKGGEGGTPENGFSGQNGQAHNVTLDLKLIADVGFVGFPNAGKSTLLKGISRARPRIAAFPFTTIRPNVGMVEYPDGRLIALADLPGLIEGAHANIGMGFKFLKHVERTKLLLFVVDLHGFQLSPKHLHRSALETIVLLNKELELYQEDLTLKPAILALNKIDKPNSYSLVEQVRDVLFDEDKYKKYVDGLPTEMRPKHRLQFDQIVPISALKDPSSVQVLRDIIRKNIDVNYELDQLEKDSLTCLPDR